MASLSTDRPITPLRQRMMHDMMMRGLGPHTQQDYVRHVRRLAAFLGRPPDAVTTEDLRRFQLDQHERGLSPATINGAVSALRFLFTVTLKRRDLARCLVITRNPRKLPDVLSVEEAARLLEAAPGIKYKAALGVAYGAGLRVSEVAHLKVDDIDSKRMLIRVEEGKGRKDRNAMLSPQLLELMTLAGDEFIRRFLLHVLPRGFHRIRHYGLLASSAHKACIARARELLGVAVPPALEEPTEPTDLRPPCPCCGGSMVIIETFERWCQPRAPPAPTMPTREIVP